MSKDEPVVHFEGKDMPASEWLNLIGSRAAHGQTDVVVLDYETMMREAEEAFANSNKPDIMAVARVTAARIAANPGALMDWPMFLELNKTKRM